MENLFILINSLNSENEIAELSFEKLERNHSKEYEIVMKELLKYFLRYNVSNVQLEDTAKLMNLIANI